MSLLTPSGMIRDEGLINTIKIMLKALKKENKDQFFKMKKIFNKYKKHLGFSAVKSVK